MDGSTLSVTSSLARALPFLSKASRTGYLWVDQITIDQVNTTERSDQVRVMGDIYSRCERCLIWIDRDPFLDAEYDVASDWSQGMGEDVLNFFQSFNDEDAVNEGNSLAPVELRRFSTRSTSTSSQSQDTRRDSQSRVKDHLQWFFEHPWFKRVWVYQEFVLSPHSSFLIGDFELPGDEIERVFRYGWLRSAEWFHTLHHRLGMSKTHAALLHKAPGFEFFLGAIQSRQLYTAPEDSAAQLGSSANRHIDGFPNYESISFADILEKMGGSQASDNRDHVYAFIGLAPCLLKYMTIDYSLTVEECFAAMMKAMIKETNCLDFWATLPCENDVSKSDLRLPSWVCNWTVYSQNYRILTHDNLFNACGPGYGLPTVGKCKHFHMSTSAWNELLVAGKIIDTVEVILQPYSAYQMRESIGVDLQEFPGNLPWEASTLDMFMAELDERNGFKSRFTSKTAMLRTLFMDGVQWAAIDASNSGTSLYRTGIQTFGAPHYKKIADVVSALTSSEKVDWDALPYGATPQILHELSRVQYQRRIACCAGERLALVPDLAERGDRIAILHGSRAPVVLRRRLAGTFAVIGQCYYDGAMYGDVADPDDDDAVVMTIT